MRQRLYELWSIWDSRHAKSRDRWLVYGYMAGRKNNNKQKKIEKEKEVKGNSNGMAMGMPKMLYIATVPTLYVFIS